MQKSESGRTILLLLLLSVLFLSSNAQKNKKGNSYYISNIGNDSFPGTKQKPWKSIDHLNKMQLYPGDTVCFESGQSFKGSILIDSLKKGDKNHPLIITSTANKPAIILSGDNPGITLYKTCFVRVQHLHFKGAGRKSGNTKNGMFIINSNHIALKNIDVNGYQKAGLEIYSSTYVTAQHIYAYDNGFAGISVSGDYQNKISSRDIIITECRAENNPGDPSNLSNHSGNGIVVSHCTKVTIQYCVATNNGWDMPRIGNGPVGIWMFEADSVLIQYCISYRNKTSKGAADGGGFDIDGGVSNSIIQYCLSYENYGSGFGIFQYYEAGPWFNNTIRFCISENDGLVSDARAGVYVWNGQGDSSKFHHCYFYNNTIYNSKGAAISYSELSKNKDFFFINNIFVAKDSLLKGIESNGTYLGNDWWSLGKFSIEGRKTLKEWAISKNKERYNMNYIGSEIDPRFKNPGKAHLIDPMKLSRFYNYLLPDNSILKVNGFNLSKIGIRVVKDFNQHSIMNRGIGACL